jgi:uncharacterized protein (UPF0147 family)
MSQFKILLLPLRIFEWVSRSITGSLNAITSEAKDALLDELEDVGREMSHTILTIKEVVNDSSIPPETKAKVDTIYIHGIELSKLLVDIHDRLINNNLSPADFDSAHQVVEDAKSWSKMVDSNFF